MIMIETRTKAIILSDFFLIAKGRRSKARLKKTLNIFKTIPNLA